MISCPLARASKQVSDRFLTSSLASATSWQFFWLEKPVSDKIALSRHVIVLAGLRQDRDKFAVFWCASQMDFEKRQTYEPVRHFFDTVNY